MNWSIVKLTDAQIANHDLFRLQSQFEAIFATALAPPDAAMFGNLRPACDHNFFYFSPKAAEIFGPLLARWNAYPGDAPEPDSTALLVGHAGAFDLLKANKAG